MRSAIEEWLLGYWYGERRPPWFLRLLETVYRRIFHAVQIKQRNGSGFYRSKRPLIMVGNITVGGSGKTPLVIRLCQLAQDLNLRPGIASTGYGRLSKDNELVTPQSDARTCGDEPVLLAMRTSVPVVVAATRLQAVRMLDAMDLDLIISDDGLQQADIARDIEFCVVDGDRGLGNGRLLPAGPLREGETRLRQVDYVISNGEWRAKPGDLDVSVMTLKANFVCSLDDKVKLSVEKFLQNQSGKKIHAIAAIGNPQRFFNMLEKLGIHSVGHGFADHHLFSPRDFDSLEVGSAIIMTQKDAVKCRSLGLENAWYMPVDTCIPERLEHVLKEQMLKMVKVRR